MTSVMEPVLGKTTPDEAAPDKKAPDEKTALDEVELVEAAYGWCGLCHSFTDFPHDCHGNDLSPGPEEIAAA
jgi:hypothetical protein